MIKAVSRIRPIQSWSENWTSSTLRAKNFKKFENLYSYFLLSCMCLSIILTSFVWVGFLKWLESYILRQLWLWRTRKTMNSATGQSRVFLKFKKLNFSLVTSLISLDQKLLLYRTELFTEHWGNKDSSKNIILVTV